MRIFILLVGLLVGTSAQSSSNRFFVTDFYFLDGQVVASEEGGYFIQCPEEFDVELLKEEMVQRKDELLAYLRDIQVPAHVRHHLPQIFDIDMEGQLPLGMAIRTRSSEEESWTLVENRVADLGLFPLNFQRNFRYADWPSWVNQCSAYTQASAH